MPQRRPGNFLVGDVKNQPHDTGPAIPSVREPRDVEERLKWAPVFSSQRCLMVAQRIPFDSSFNKRPRCDASERGLQTSLCREALADLNNQAFAPAPDSLRPSPVRLQKKAPS